MSKVKVVFNSCFGGFGLSAEAVNLYLEKSGSALPDEVSRHDPILVEVVEALDQVAAGFCSYLKIKEVPIIWNYDDATKINVLKQIKVMGRDLLLIWYESHLMWLQNLPTYPQKRGSRKARLFFLFLSLFLKTKTNL